MYKATVIHQHTFSLGPPVLPRNHALYTAWKESGQHSPVSSYKTTKQKPPRITTDSHGLITGKLMVRALSHVHESGTGAVTWGVSKQWTRVSEVLFQICHLQMHAGRFLLSCSQQASVEHGVPTVWTWQACILFVVIYLHHELIHFRSKTNCFQQSLCFYWCPSSQPSLLRATVFQKASILTREHYAIHLSLEHWCGMREQARKWRNRLPSGWRVRRPVPMGKKSQQFLVFATKLPFKVKEGNV